MKKIYTIGIGWIGISGIARYYQFLWYEVWGSDSVVSDITRALEQEGIHVSYEANPDEIDATFEKIFFTSAISSDHPQLQKARVLGIPVFSYSQALSEVVNKKTLISIAGSHGKSTTTALVSLVLKNSTLWVNALVGSQLREFNGKNVTFSQSPLFVIEACEYKRQFLEYRPKMWVIVNIDLDHLDYYKDEADYVSAFAQYIDRIVPSGYAILAADNQHTPDLVGKRTDIEYILVGKDRYSFFYAKTSKPIPEFVLQVPGEHILFDAKIAYTIGDILKIPQENIIHTLQNYTGIWRRSELVGMTPHGNIVMSDYGHHPTEILLNVSAIKEKYAKKIVVVIFQPHQYSRTLELLNDFQTCFLSADILLVTDIYESRDTPEDKEKINGRQFAEGLSHTRKIYTGPLSETLAIWKMIDAQHSNQMIVILQWAGDIDSIRGEMVEK